MARSSSKDDIGLATASMQLTKTLIDFSTTGTWADAGKEMYNWLVRERLDERSFNACRDLAADLAHPNQYGMQLQEQIQKSDLDILSRVKQAPLQLVVSGSLGRLIGRLPQVSYMVTTVAALTRVHRPEFVTRLLCSMMLDQGGHEQGVTWRYEVRRAPVRAVISKIVDSIFLNVTNAGQELPELPEQFRNLHKHLLDDATFAGIVIGMTRMIGDVTILSDRFLADLTIGCTFTSREHWKWWWIRRSSIASGVDPKIERVL